MPTFRTTPSSPSSARGVIDEPLAFALRAATHHQDPPAG
jgi:hypothetical protein